MDRGGGANGDLHVWQAAQNRMHRRGTIRGTGSTGHGNRALISGDQEILAQVPLISEHSIPEFQFRLVWIHRRLRCNFGSLCRRAWRNPVWRDGFTAGSFRGANLESQFLEIQLAIIREADMLLYRVAVIGTNDQP